VAKRVRIGNAQMPIYALSGYALAVVLLVIDQSVLYRGLGKIGLAVLITGALIHILDKQDRNRVALSDKMDRCVGKVWDAGGRARERQYELEQADRSELAVVRTLAPRP
jgi:hypothetical protein